MSETYTCQFETGATNMEARAVDVFEDMREHFAQNMPFDRFLVVERIWFELMRDHLKDEVEE